MLRSLESAEPLRRYIAIKEQLKALEAELAELQPLIFDALTEEPEQRASFAGYELTVQYRRTYQYSDRVQALEQDLKAMKDREVQAGLAEPVRVTGFVVMKAVKS